MERGEADLGRELAAVLAPAGEVQADTHRTRPRIGDVAGAMPPGGVAHALGEQELDGLVQQLVAAVPEELLGLRVDEHDPPLTIHPDDGVGSGIEQVAEPAAGGRGARPERPDLATRDGGGGIGDLARTGSRGLWPSPHARASPVRLRDLYNASRSIACLQGPGFPRPPGGPRPWPALTEADWRSCRGAAYGPARKLPAFTTCRRRSGRGAPRRARLVLAQATVEYRDPRAGRPRNGLGA